MGADEQSLPELFRLIRPLVGEESDKCGIMAESGEDAAWAEAWEVHWVALLDLRCEIHRHLQCQQRHDLRNQSPVPRHFHQEEVIRC